MRARARTSLRGFSSVEIAAAVAVVGSLLAVAVPAFVRNVSASHLVEATEGLARIQEGVIALSKADGHLPEATPLTPATVPRAERVLDPPGTWDAPGWRAIHFSAAPEGMSHRYAFAMDRPSEGDLVARAHGDLDGDGVLSAFELRLVKDPDGAHAVGGLIVSEELE